ncbi:MAG TPA: universal stress protein [Terriglobia bacterium]|nr:universal stress protein [Terriglobia bacterium]
MLKIERILCPMDFSELSAKSYTYARSLAQHYEARLFLEHVVQPLSMAYPFYAFPDTLGQVYTNLLQDAEKHLKEVVQNFASNGMQPELVVREGFPTDSILSFAQTQAVDLIVMGTHGRRGFDRITMGSVTEQVLRKARCPVLVIRRPTHDFVNPGQKQEQVHLSRILFCTDFSTHSDRALQYALSLALEYNAELTLLHVLEIVGPTHDFQIENSKICKRLEQAIPEEAKNWCKVKPIVRAGQPYTEIIKLATETSADLVILGVRGRNALDLALFGSTTHRVIQLGPCPVLAVHI